MIKIFRVLLPGIFLLILSCPMVKTETKDSTNTNSTPINKYNIPCGINLAGLCDWSEEVPFKDFVKFARPWNNENRTGLTLDENGWVTSLAPNTTAELIWDAPQTNPYGEFVCLYDGDGDVEINSSFIDITYRSQGRIEFTISDAMRKNSGSGFWGIVITRTNPADYVRNIRIIKREYESDYQTDPWNPVFIERIINRFNTLRFMDWQATNNSLTENWADRKTKYFYNQSSSNTGKSTSVAVEYMVDICNRTNSNGWFCIPHLANDDYIQKFASYLHDNMKPDLKIYIEYSNECWNWQFAQTEYCHVQGVSLNLDPDEWTAWRKFYAKRSIEIFHIFETVFAGQTGRLVRVLASQGAYYDMTARVLDYVYPDGTGMKAATHADALAIAPYFGGSTHEQPDSWSINDIFGYLDTQVNGTGTPGNGETVRQSMIDNYEMFIKPNPNLKLIAYEGGQHLLPLRLVGADWLLDPAKLSLYREAQTDPRMYSLYKQYLTHWREAGGQMFMIFSSVGNWGEWGYWGILPDLSGTSSNSPKYNAVID